MRLLHIKGTYGEIYIAIDKIEGFEPRYNEEKRNYSVDMIVNSRSYPLANNVSEPQKIVEDLVKIIDTIDNNIIEYSIKGEE